MDTSVVVLLGLVMLLGLVGIVVPVMPGLLLVWGAGLVWTLLADGSGRWVVLAVMTVLLVLGAGLKWVLPARLATGSGAPRRAVLWMAAGIVVGFFVLPPLGALVGAVVGVYVGELVRLRDPAAAWPSTRAALLGVGIGVLAEIAAGVLMVATWLLGLALT